MTPLRSTQGVDVMTSYGADTTGSFVKPVSDVGLGWFEDFLPSRDAGIDDDL